MTKEEEAEVRIPMLTLPYDYYKVMFIKVFEILVQKGVISEQQASKIIEETEEEMKKMHEEIDRLNAERMKAIRERDENEIKKRD